MLLLCALTVGVASAWADTKIKWVKVAPADLVEGDVVAIVDTTTCAAMANDPQEGKAPSAKAVTLNENKDQIDTSKGDLAANLQWTVAIPEAGKYQFKKDDTNFLFARPNNADTDSLLVGAADGDGDVNVFQLVKDQANNQADFLYAAMSDAKGYYVGVVDFYGFFQMWVVSPTIDEDISSTVITFFKKVDSDKKDLKITFEKDNYEFDLDGAETFVSPIATTDPEGKPLTYSSSDEWVAKVDATTGEVTIRHRGIATITASFAEDEEYDATSASYILRVDKSNEEGGMNNPLMASDAYDAITHNDLATGSVYFIKGIVSKIGNDNDILSYFTSSFEIPGLDSGGGITYYISDNGSSAEGVKQIEVTSGRGLANEELKSQRNICVGDEVIVVGQVSYSSSTPGLGMGTGTGTGTGSEQTPKIDKGNYMYQYTPRIIAPDVEIYNGTSHKISDLALVNDECESVKVPGEPTVENQDDAANQVVTVTTAGKLNANAEGCDTLTVSCPFKADEADAEPVFTTVRKFYVTVKSINVEPAGQMPGHFALVTDETTLQENDSILIVATLDDKSYVLSSTGAIMGGLSGKEVSIEDDGSIKTVPDGATPVKLKAVGASWALNTTDNKYIYTSNSAGDGFDIMSLISEPSNKLRHGEIAGEIGDSAQVAITIDGEGLATIKLRGDSIMRYAITDIGSITGGSTGTSTGTGSTGTGSSGYNMSSFNCYAPDATDGVLVKLYRFQEVADFEITVGADGWRSLVSSKNVTLPEGLKAYIVTEVADDKAMLTEVDEIKAGEPYILKGEAEGATYSLTTVADAAAPEGNMLKVSTKSTADGVYVLASENSLTGFYKWEGGLLGSGRVYLPATSAARFISIDGVATAIKTVDNSQPTTASDVYNLAGQRVSPATLKQGLYISNGKKQIVK